MGWIPTIHKFAGPIYRRIANAIEADVGSRRLVRGQQSRSTGTGKSGRRRSDDHQPILWRGTPEGTVGRARRDGLVRVRDHSKARRRHASSRCHRSFHERSATPLGSAT
jgi:hypothetical protein